MAYFMKDDYTINSHCLTYTFLLKKVGRMYFLNLGVEGFIKVPGSCKVHVCVYSLCFHSVIVLFLSCVLDGDISSFSTAATDTIGEI